MRGPPRAQPGGRSTAMEALTGRIVKRYRIYERELAPDPAS